MSHDVHFLERSVERLARPEMETALRLYKDPDLLRFILEKATVPDGADRVALSLSPAGEGPYVIVTREGRFVTCLSEGMRLDSAHRLSYSQVGALAARHEHWLERWRLANERTDEGRRLGRLMLRLPEAGVNLPREDIEALAGWMPTIGPELKRFLLEYFIDRPKLFDGVHEPCLGKKADSAALKLLGLLWGHEHGVGHIMALLGSENACEPLGRDIDIGFAFRTGWQTGCLAPAMHVAWSFGRLGKPWLKPLKSGFRTASTLTAMFNVVFGLVQMALQHKGLRGEVRKFISSEQPGASWIPELRWVRDHLVPMVDDLFEDTGEFEEHQLTTGRELITAAAGGNPALAALFPDPASIPEEIARAATLRHWVNRHSKLNDMLFRAVTLQPWLARASLADLYLPQEVVSIWRMVPTPGDLQTMALNYFPAAGQETVRKEKTPGRNEPCPCGSGKKYKRCCGSANAR